MLFSAKQFFEIFFSNYERNWMGFDSFWWVNLPTVLFIAHVLFLTTMLLLPSVIPTSGGEFGCFGCR